jgi:hypothetical protein
MGVTAYLSASRSSFTGPIGWLRRLFFNAFGLNGDIILYVGIGTACVVFGLLKYRTKQ